MDCDQLSIRDLRGSSKPDQKEGELIDAAVDKAAKAKATAEAEVAKALGYQLCKREFRPVPMLMVG
jgi:predicted secreted protein